MYQKMGSGGGAGRGHLRLTRSSKFSSFLIAALTVGLGILAISYWSLSSQYTALEAQLSVALQKQDADFRGEQLLHNQLQQKEEELSKVKITLEKSNSDMNSQTEQLNSLTQQLKSMQTELTDKARQLTVLSQEKATLQQDKQACDEGQKKIQQDLDNAREEIKRLKSELDLREKAAPIAEDQLPSKKPQEVAAPPPAASAGDKAEADVQPSVAQPAAAKQLAASDNAANEDGLDKIGNLREQLPPPKVNQGDNQPPPTDMEKNLDAAVADELSDNRYRLSMDKADQEAK